MTLERWVTRLRVEDLERMGTVGVLKDSEVAYFLPMLKDVLNGTHDVAYAASDWQNLRDAVTVRSPLWV